MEVLGALGEAGGTAGVTEISEKVGLPASTVYRLLVALINSGMARKSGEGYSLGPRMLELAFSATRHWDIVSLAMPFLEELRDTVDESAALALRFEDEYAFMGQVASEHEARVTFVLGRRYPLHWAAAGKAILAHLPQEEIDLYLQQYPLAPSTNRTITDPKELLAQLNQIRASGYAVSFGERVEGHAAIAAPIADRAGSPGAALAIGGPELRVQRRDVAQIGLQLTETAKRLESACWAHGLCV
jgi:IclR family acetate operon transcriptional repressor